MGQAMAIMYRRFLGREAGKSLLLSSGDVDDEIERNKTSSRSSFLTRFWQLWEAIIRRFRAAPKPPSNPVSDCHLNSQDYNALINPHCIVDIQVDCEIQRPVSPVLVEKEHRPNPPLISRSSSSSSSRKMGSLGPYSWEQKILLVGDGDFSFSASLAVAFGNDASNMIATSLNSKEFLMKNYVKAATNILELTSRSCRVMHRVDATKMARHPQLHSLKFDCIVYNFPHAGFANKKDSRDAQINKHQALVRGFLKNAKKMIKEDGQIHITHKCVGFFLEWNLEMLGESQGLRLVEESPFKAKLYPGYATKYGYGGDANFNCKPAKRYKFQLDNSPNLNKKKSTKNNQKS